MRPQARPRLGFPSRHTRGGRGSPGHIGGHEAVGISGGLELSPGAAAGTRWAPGSILLPGADGQVGWGESIVFMVRMALARWGPGEVDQEGLP